MPSDETFSDCKVDSRDFYSSSKEMYISKKEMCLRLQSCATLLSRRQSVNAVDFNVSYENINTVTSLTKEHYLCKRMAGSKYKLGKLFVSEFYSPEDKTLKVTISQYGNVQVSCGKKSQGSQEKLGLHVSLRCGKTLISKHKIDISQNAALRVFKYNYVSSFNDIAESGLSKSFLRIKLKSKGSVFRGAYTIAQRDIELRNINPGTETPLDVLFL